MTCATVPAGHVCLCADGAADCTDQEGNVDGRRKGEVRDRGTRARERKRNEETMRERVEEWVENVFVEEFKIVGLIRERLKE